jgi:hypothetical protein
MPPIDDVICRSGSGCLTEAELPIWVPKTAGGLELSPMLLSAMSRYDAL